jgi:class 3 adenylate cyclase/PAS domain-containing protein
MNVFSGLEAEEPLGEFHRRNEMLDAVAYAATRIVAASDWRQHIDDLLERLGKVTDMSRVSLFEVHEGADGRLVQSCRHDWAEAGLARLSGDGRYHEMSLEDESNPAELNDWSRRRMRGEVVQATLREVDGYTRQVFVEHGTLAFISVPILVNGRWWGFLGFDDCRQERIWSSAEIRVLETAAALIAGAIERERMYERLRLSEERYALAAKGANDGLIDWDMEENRAYFAPRLYQILSLPEGSLGSAWPALLKQLAPADARRLSSHFARCVAERRESFEVECRLAGREGGDGWIVLRGLIVYRAGKPCRFVGALRNISRRKQAELKFGEAERKRASLARYFSPNMVEELVQSGGRLDTARTQDASVLFADVWGFTSISANLPGLEVIALLRDYLGLVEEAVFAHGGTLDKFLGDGLMATFGTPRLGPKDATNAVSCACAITGRVVQWNARRREAGLEPLRIGIGLHHGEVVLGDIGSARRMEFAVIGDTVNVASRIQEMTRALGPAILASEAIVAAVGREGSEGALAGWRNLGRHALRGRQGEIGLWGRAAETD